MNVQDFINDIANGVPAPLYLFCPFKAPRARNATFEPFLAERAIERFMGTFVDESMRDLMFSSFYTDEADPRQIVLECETLPFLVERRVVLVRHAERFELEAPAKVLLPYLDNPCPSTVLLLVAAKVDRRSKFYKACAKAGEIVECPQLSVREAERWVMAEAQERGKRLDSRAAQELVGRTGSHLSDVENALNLLVNFVGDTKDQVTEDDVIAACADVAEEEIWTLTDAIAQSDTDRALTALRRILDLGKSEPEIMGTINWLLKSAYAVATAEHGPPKISPFVAKKVGPLSDKLGRNKLRDAFALCINTELMLRSTGVDRTLALELLVVKLATPRSNVRREVAG